MDDIEKAVSITKRLRRIIMNIVGLEKEKENYDASDDRIEDFFTEAAGDDDTPAVDLLTHVDTLLYALLSAAGTGEAWVDADDVETREILKLKEIVNHHKKFQLKEILLPTAA